MCVESYPSAKATASAAVPIQASLSVPAKAFVGKDGKSLQTGVGLRTRNLSPAFIKLRMVVHFCFIGKKLKLNVSVRFVLIPPDPILFLSDLDTSSYTICTARVRKNLSYNT